MVDRTLAYMGLQFAKFQFRSDFDTVQPFTDFLRTARNCLIVLPAGYEESVVAGNALNGAGERLSHLHLTVLHNSTRGTSLTAFPRCEVVRMNTEDINRFALPKKSVLQRIFNRHYDVAIDMNLDFVLHSAYICKASHASVRVGCANSASDIFFNVQLKFDRSGPHQAVYEKFASRLAMF